jgi:hypothetical protein
MNKFLIFKPRIYWAVALYIFLTFLVLALGEQVAGFAFPEDHYFENVGAVSFFAASILFFSSFLYARKPHLAGRIFWVKQLVYLGLALLFFFGGGEEISWGQRIFNIQTPDSLNAINNQGEITVHNISFGGHQIPFETLFDLLWLFLAVLIPLTAIFVKPLERFLPIVHWGIGSLFLLDYLWAKGAKMIFKTLYTFDRVPFVQAVQEIKESNYAFLFAFFALFIFLDLKRFEKENTQ